eukprot:GHVT01094414.1.p1 GENE.GHVT01094414.1~~GHVT01094414.1.p1  ORF type:complete len:268 (-),score=10.63 GHVT01094414.1:127-930(-)
MNSSADCHWPPWGSFPVEYFPFKFWRGKECCGAACENEQMISRRNAPGEDTPHLGMGRSSVAQYTESAVVHFIVYLFGLLLCLCIYYNYVVLQAYFLALFWAVIFSVPLYQIKRTVMNFLIGTASNQSEWEEGKGVATFDSVPAQSHLSGACNSSPPIPTGFGAVPSSRGDAATAATSLCGVPGGTVTEAWPPAPQIHSGAFVIRRFPPAFTPSLRCTPAAYQAISIDTIARWSVIIWHPICVSHSLPRCSFLFGLQNSRSRFPIVY